ncbi:MAG: T9SS type A sorting domain-containing protein, partial [Saprospiraceae bacterium]|nr:T9SS type A sorting domain-containing protein [Saprospiraceae bacterium]
TNPMMADGAYSVTVTDANGCTVDDAIQMYANVATDTVYAALQPDSSLNACENLPVFIASVNSLVQNNSILGTFTANPLPSACFDYVAPATANNVDILEVVTCDLFCDTTIYIIETGTCVWPGDADDNQIVDNQDLLAIGLHYGTSGLTRIDASTDYTCQPSRDWGTVLTGSASTDIKHLDTDGNSVINDDDTLAISLNWNQVHLRSNDNWDRNGVPVTIGTDMATPGDGVALPIYLGDATDIVNNGYGIAFTVEYDSAIVEPNSVAISFDNAWLGTSANSLSIQKDFYNDQNIQTAFTRTDQMALTGSGQLGTIYLTIKDVVLPRNNDEIRLNLNITNVRLIDNTGVEIPVSPEAGEVLISSTMKTIKDEESLGLNLYPNPTKDQLTVELEQTTIEQIKVYNMSSQLILDLRPTGMEKQHTLSVESLEAGAYILEVQTPKGLSHKMFVKQ